MVGICHLTDSHHNHHGQKPTMVGICHGGNMLGNLEISNEQIFVLEPIRIHSIIRQTLAWASLCMLCSILNPGGLFRLSYSLNNSFLEAPFQFHEETISKKQCKHYAQDVKHMGSDDKKVES